MSVPHIRPADPSLPPRISPPIIAPVTDLVAETEALQMVLRDALGRVSRLVVALKQRRRQHKLVDIALTSLRQLQPPA